MKSGMKSKLTVCSVAAGAAALGIATSAQALNLGDIGSGIYAEFGPDDGAGNNLGLVSESWDAWVPAAGWGAPTVSTSVPTRNAGVAVGAYAGDTVLSDVEGYMLLGLDVYTGEVVTSLDPTQQYGTAVGNDPGPKYGYTGDGFTFGLRSSVENANPDYDVNWDVNDPGYDPTITDPAHPLYDATKAASQTQYGSPIMFTPNDAQLPTYEAGADARAAGGDFIWFTSEAYETDSGKTELVFGSHINVTTDGTIAANVGTAGNPVSGETMVDYTYLYNAGSGYGMSGYSWDSPQPGRGAGFWGFTMDGIEGWFELGLASGNRSGVTLLSYYFDFVGGSDPLDIDGDGDVDADDIDMLFTMVGGTDMTGDLNGDLVVDGDDVDFWVANVPIGENTGTVYGDFNLDGAVDAGDLALLGGSFGLAGPFGWANGDATGDGVVDAGDLALLGGNFGTIVHPVPEPVTMSLLAIGGAALLRRRK
jgi:hypothetical protein